MARRRWLGGNIRGEMTVGGEDRKGSGDFGWNTHTHVDMCVVIHGCVCGSAYSVGVWVVGM